ncbi:hypothetical protein G6F31_013322 [Rhizopus arrhizus]|nr:hypothetical protein G6F31_013322 [Rhizopus arrhizus]
MTLPIGGADMPVVISLYNAFTGLAVSFEGYVLGNEALIIAGMMVGAAGILLTRLMAKAMNRPIRNVLFSNFGGGAGGEAQAISGSQKPIEAADVAAMMAFAERVVIVPGYGMAVAQAQHKIWELAQRLGQRGVKVKFAIHPVAGRMPGHMNVLLAEAGVPYDLIADMDDINPEFANTDVVLVIGANDVVNPVARTDPASPIYGMPVLDVVNARNVVVIKRGKGTGFAGIENALFYADNTRMLYGDGAEAAASLVRILVRTLLPASGRHDPHPRVAALGRCGPWSARFCRPAAGTTASHGGRGSARSARQPGADDHGHGQPQPFHRAIGQGDQGPGQVRTHAQAGGPQAQPDRAAHPGAGDGPVGHGGDQQRAQHDQRDAQAARPQRAHAQHEHQFQRGQYRHPADLPTGHQRQHHPGKGSNNQAQQQHEGPEPGHGPGTRGIGGHRSSQKIAHRILWFAAVHRRWQDGWARMPSCVASATAPYRSPCIPVAANLSTSNAIARP